MLRTIRYDECGISTDTVTYLYNENTGEIIHAAFGMNENGDLFEIPLDEYKLILQREHQNLARELEMF